MPMLLGMLALVSSAVPGAYAAPKTPNKATTEAPAAAVASKKFKLTLGELKFVAPASVKAFNVHGQAEELEGSLELAGNEVKQLLVTVSPEKLTTKMSMRDKHMRERIFETGGKFPTIRFTGQGTCTGTDVLECPLKGNMSIRDVEAPFELALKITPDGDKQKLSGSTIVKLSSFKIEKPSQLGITVADEVNVSFDVGAVQASAP
ncbi:MAG: YceI family protein [Bacteriovoracia bacterium]